MNQVWRKAFGITGLIFMLGGAPSWGAPPNNDESDAAGNTASGFYALSSNTIGRTNTASGVYALGSTTTGSGNTSSGESALAHNSTGSGNTSSGAGALYTNTT